MKFNKNWVCRNAANGITSFGILLCFVIQWVIYIHPVWIMKALICLGAGIMVSDFIDGPVARYFERNGYEGSISPTGKFLDRFRDKDFQLTMFFFFAFHPKVEYHLKWAFTLLIISEFVLLGTLFVGVKKKMDVAAADWGKWKMFLECVAIFVCLLNLFAQEHGIKAFSTVAYVLTGMAVISFGFAVMSIKGHVSPFFTQKKSVG